MEIGRAIPLLGLGAFPALVAVLYGLFTPFVPLAAVGGSMGAVGLFLAAFWDRPAIKSRRKILTVLIVGGLFAATTVLTVTLYATRGNLLGPLLPFAVLLGGPIACGIWVLGYLYGIRGLVIGGFIPVGSLAVVAFLAGT